MSVYKKNDKWYLYVTYNGIRYRRKTNIKTKAEALLLEAEYRRKLELEGTGLYTKNKLVTELISEYSDFLKEQRSINTYLRSTSILRNFQRHVSPHTAMEITPSLLDQYISKRKKDSYRGITIAKRTINSEITIIKAMMNWALKRKHISHNPITGYEKLRVPEQPKLKFLSLDDINKLLERLSPMMYPIILTFLKTGMRRNELVYLKWEDIDLDKKMITVKSEDASTSHHSKTYEARHIPIDDELVETLQKYRKQSSQSKPNDLVFCTKDGKVRKNNMIRELKRQAKSIGIEYITIHMLRHSYASHLRMSGADLGAVGKLLGHKNPNTTKIYEHLSPDFLRKTTDLLPIKISK